MASIMRSFSVMASPMAEGSRGQGFEWERRPASIRNRGKMPLPQVPCEARGLTWLKLVLFPSLSFARPLEPCISRAEALPQRGITDLGLHPRRVVEQKIARRVGQSLPSEFIREENGDGDHAPDRIAQAGENADRDTDVTLSFLGDAHCTVTLITDGEDARTFEAGTRAVTGQDHIEVHLKPYGGFAAVLTPCK